MGLGARRRGYRSVLGIHNEIVEERRERGEESREGQRTWKRKGGGRQGERLLVALVSFLIHMSEGERVVLEVAAVACARRDD